MISWSVAIGLIVVAFIAGFVAGRRKSERQVVWSERTPAEPTPDVMKLLQSGRKIDAIKLYRQLHGTDLKDAKDAVESLERRFPPGQTEQL